MGIGKTNCDKEAYGWDDEAKAKAEAEDADGGGIDGVVDTPVPEP